MLSQIEIFGFRNLTEGTLRFGEKNLIVGENAQGKSNLLEAIYFLFSGRSMRTKKLVNLIKNGTDYTRLIGINNNEELEQFLSTQNHLSKINKIPKKLSEFWHKYPLITFIPSDVELIEGEPSERRRDLDIFLAQLDPNYIYLLREYNSALEQRNNLLKKSNFSKEELLVWDERILEPGENINKSRREAAKALNEQIFKIGNDLGIGKLKLELSQKEYDFAEMLCARIEIDKKLGHTSVGPHREDWFLKKDNLNISGKSSRGEQRMLMLALRLAQALCLADKKERPIVIFDDIFSELDQRNQDLILNYLSEFQTFISSLNDALGTKWASTIFKMENGVANEL